MQQQGVKVVTIVDPGVKYQVPQAGAKDALTHPELAPQNQSYYVYNQGIEKRFFLRRQDGNLYIGRVWPGDSVFVDYTLPAARRWWGDLHRALTDHGVAGIWTDMNEPSDFVDQTGTTQLDVVSYDEGQLSTHAKNRNVFALLMARATYEGLERLRPNERPFVITRAGYAGIQRYATMWTGDNTSTWEALSLSLPMLQSLGLSGETFVGADIGGFFGSVSAELLTRWYQVGFLTPLCRNHKAIGGYDQEPWRFGQYYEDIIRKYLQLRYRLLPFLYTTLEEAHRTGVPLLRPLLLNYQHDANTLTIDDEFMVGSDLLVAPILHTGQTQRLVYLPEDTWYDYWTGKQHAGGVMLGVDAPLETVPLFVRAGAMIPLRPHTCGSTASRSIPANPLRNSAAGTGWPTASVFASLMTVRRMRYRCGNRPWKTSPRLYTR
jgi:alpha-glucosidase